MADTKSVFLTIDLEPGVEYTAIDFTTHPREAFTVSQPIRGACLFQSSRSAFRLRGCEIGRPPNTLLPEGGSR
jgi:hypothetical protein